MGPVPRPPRKAALAVDHGTKRTGFAGVDALRLAPAPLDVVEGGDDAALDALARHLDERDVGDLVVGHPLNMDGTAGPRAAEVDAFVARVRARFPELAVHLQDERLTTKEAEERLADAGYFGKERKARRDSWSALVLLEDWIRAGG